MRDVVRCTLERQGFEVLVAEDATTAETLFKLNRKRVALLLTDVVMPGRSGPELYAKLVAAKPDLKVLFMTGYSPADVFTDSETRHPIIAKPFETGELSSAVQRLLEAGQSAPIEAGERRFVDTQ